MGRERATTKETKGAMKCVDGKPEECRMAEKSVSGTREGGSKILTESAHHAIGTVLSVIHI